MWHGDDREGIRSHNALLCNAFDLVGEQRGRPLWRLVDVLERSKAPGRMANLHALVEPATVGGGGGSAAGVRVAQACVLRAAAALQPRALAFTHAATGALAQLLATADAARYAHALATKEGRALRALRAAALELATVVAQRCCSGAAAGSYHLSNTVRPWDIKLRNGAVCARVLQISYNICSQASNTPKIARISLAPISTIFG